MGTFDLFEKTITRPKGGGILIHIFGIRVRRNVPTRDKREKDFGKGNGLSEFSLGHVGRVEKGNDRPFGVGDVGLLGVVGESDGHVACHGPVGHHSAYMVRILAGAVHLIGDHLWERACSFGWFILRRETEDPFLIIGEGGLSLGTGARSTRAMRGSGRCRLSEGRLGPVDKMPRGRIRILILIVRIERWVERIRRMWCIINTRGLLG